MNGVFSVLSSLGHVCAVILSHSLEKRRKHNTNQPAPPFSLTVLLSLFTQNRLLSCVSSSVAMSFFLLCCWKRIMAAPAQKHMQNIHRPTWNPRVPATTREITFIMGYTISQCGLPRPLLWTFISQGLEQGREVSTCLFADGPSPLALNAVLFICMIRHMQMSRVLLWPCVCSFVANGLVPSHSSELVCSAIIACLSSSSVTHCNSIL